MAKRPAHTVIFVGVHRTDRVDLGDGPEFPVVAQHHQASHDTDDLALRVESSLGFTSQVGKQVWVLWEGAIAQMLEMPSAAVEGLERDQLSDALSFEAEPLTGINATDSAIQGIVQREANVHLSELRRFWLTQISASLRDKLQDVATRARSKFAGIAHPGGLPREKWDAEHQLGAIAERAAEWRRIEVWDQVTFSLHGKRDGTVETRLIRAAPGSDWWSAELPEEGSISWMGPVPATRVAPGARRASESASLLNGEGHAIQLVKADLSANAAPVEWLRAWAGEFTAKVRRVPVVEPVSNVSPHRKFYVAGGIAAGLALLICVGHGELLSIQASAAIDKARRLEAMQVQLAPKDTSREQEQKISVENAELLPGLSDLQKQEAELSGKRDTAKKQEQEFVDQQTKFSKLQAFYRPAVAELLSALADAERDEDPGEIIVKEVRGDGSGDLKLTGLSKLAANADIFRNKLQERLSKVGWDVDTAQKRRREDLVFDFSISLTPSVLENPDVQHGNPALGKVTTVKARSDADGIRAAAGARGS